MIEKQENECVCCNENRTIDVATGNTTMMSYEFTVVVVVVVTTAAGSNCPVVVHSPAELCCFQLSPELIMFKLATFFFNICLWIPPREIS